MNTCVYLRQYLAEFLLECGPFQAKVVQKIKTYTLHDQEIFFRKSYSFFFR